LQEGTEPLIKYVETITKTRNEIKADYDNILSSLKLERTKTICR
jgi:hypothetical protein